MESVKRNIERFFSVGTTTMLHTHRTAGGETVRYKSVFRGWRASSHILLDRPKSEKGSYALLKEGQPCVIRYVYEGRAFACDTRVIDWEIHRSHPCLRISWPPEIQFISFRRHERIQVRIPCQAFPEGAPPLEGKITDISLGGCGIILPEPTETGAELSLTFALPDGTHMDRVKAIVKAARKTAEGYAWGCEFPEGNDQAESALAFYVSSSLERRAEDNTSLRPGFRVLIVDDDPEMSDRMKNEFTRGQFDVVLADNVVDCMYRLRMSLPSAMLISQRLADMDGIQVCELIKRHADFEALPIFVYGGDSTELAGQAQKAGASGYFPATSNFASDAIDIVAQELKSPVNE